MIPRMHVLVAQTKKKKKKERQKKRKKRKKRNMCTSHCTCVLEVIRENKKKEWKTHTICTCVSGLGRKEDGVCVWKVCAVVAATAIVVVAAACCWCWCLTNLRYQRLDFFYLTIMLELWESNFIINFWYVFVRHSKITNDIVYIENQKIFKYCHSFTY